MDIKYMDVIFTIRKGIREVNFILRDEYKGQSWQWYIFSIHDDGLHRYGSVSSVCDTNDDGEVVIEDQCDSI